MWLAAVLNMVVGVAVGLVVEFVVDWLVVLQLWVPVAFLLVDRA